ncbi:hypothetical protein DPMN_034276 [Dreissena polymorpha]|uniref:Uncharacterized protein n=1 Tax=Dreissena polymorpha TaxID=45954 RepID=A0A9D4RLT5_DREPO|nr:hypothetical protein DPMN_034276 [Dreissena polymorpha]
MENRVRNVEAGEQPAITRKNAPSPATGTIFELVQDIIRTNLLTKKNAHAPLFCHVFPPTKTIFELIQDFLEKNRLTKFHDDQTINVTSRVLIRNNVPPPGGHVFQPTGIIIELVQNMIGMNLLTKKNAPPVGSHVFQANVTIFELIQDIIETNLLTEFHEDWTINLASRVLTRQMLTPHDGQKAITKARHEHIALILMEQFL